MSHPGSQASRHEVMTPPEPAGATGPAPDLTVVVPLYDEEENVDAVVRVPRNGVPNLNGDKWADVPAPD